jgi:hypothetical protein
MTWNDIVVMSTDWLIQQGRDSECLCHGLTDSHRVRYARTESALVSVAVAAPSLNEPVEKDDAPRLTILHIVRAFSRSHRV